MTIQCSAKIFVFTALECEAKALVNFFGLKKDNSAHAFSIYKNDKIVVAVTGIGKVAMAGGVAYVLALFSNSPLPVLVNLGIAGHKTQEIGTLIVASKVIDGDSGRVFYPQLIGGKWPETSEIKTTAKPNTQYSQHCLNDMEASAFYETAARFSSSELIHCIKVVSDNESTTIDNIHPKKVVQWLDKHNIEIELILGSLERLSQVLEPENLIEYKEIIASWHFTVSGKVKLKTLLRRWSILSSDSWGGCLGADFRSGKELLRKLEQEIDALDVSL